MRGGSRRLAALALSITLLGGCAWMDGSYVSVTPHQVSAGQTGSDVTAIGSYADLRRELVTLVDGGQTEGLFTLADYPLERAMADMEKAAAYVTDTYPIGAYAVESITWDFGAGMGANALSVDVQYRHGKARIDQIHTVRWMSGAQDAIAAALNGCDSDVVLQVTGYHDMDYAQFAADYAAQHPDVVMEIPQITARVYPDSGDVRVVELEFTYLNSRESLRNLQSQVRPIFSSAALYVSAEADEQTKYTQLYNFLMERSEYTLESSATPAYSLLYYGVGDSRAFAQVYAAMCRQTGLEAMTVSGTRKGESRFWNIVRNGDVYYHVDLLECARQGYYRELTDGQMGDYVWDYSAYPACGVSVTEETAPAEPPETEPAPTEEPGSEPVETPEPSA